MNSKAVKILLEVLGAVVVSVALSYIPQESLPFFVDLAILPLIFVSLRQGLIWGTIASALFGLLHVFLHPTGAGFLVVPLHDSFMAYGFVGLSGFFARNTVRTAFNARTSSTTLNVVTASLIATIVSYGFHVIATGIGAPTVFSAEKVSLAQGIFEFGTNFLVTLAVTLLIFVTLIYVKRDVYIPKGTRFLSRREQSHLLND